MKEKLEYRRLNKSDIRLIPTLFKEVFSRYRDTDYWKWKYYHNPAGEHCIYSLFDADNDKICGLIGGIPVKIKLLNREVFAGQACDIVVHPEYRTAAHYFKLDRLSTEESERRNCSFIFGFANEITYSLSVRLLGFREVCPICRQIKIIKLGSFLMKKVKIEFLRKMLGTVVANFDGLLLRYRISKCKRRSIGRDLQVKEIDRFDNRFDDLWEDASKEYRIAIQRDSVYLNWRYIDKPRNDYKVFALVDRKGLQGYMVLDISNEDVRRGRILDLFTKVNKEEYALSLIFKAEEYFMEKNVDSIECWMLDHHIFYTLLKKSGFWPRKTEHILIVKPIRETSHDFLVEKTNWYLTMGDSDFF